MHGYGANWEVNKEIEDCSTTTGFAWFIANHKDKYLAATPAKIFEEIRSLDVANVSGTQDIYYYTCACMWHTQRDEVTSNGSVRAENVIYFETPGKITIYKKGVDNPVVLDLADFETAKKVYRSINGANATFTETEHLEMKMNVSIFTYGTYSLPPSSEAPYWEENEGSGENSAENVFKYYWWQKGVQKYVAATGLLDSAFNHYSTHGFWAPKTHNKYKEAVSGILESPTIKLETTTPSVEYKDGKAYIGPLKATYAGGTPSIQVEGTEVKWVTKNTDGSFNAEQASSKYKSGQVFYAVISEETAQGMTDIKVDFKINYKSYLAKLTLVKNGTLRGQNLMFHAGEETTGSKEDSWTVEQTKSITIQKQDASGNNLKVKGIVFEIYDSQNKKVGTLTTDSNGKTNAVRLQNDKEYTIKETYNSVYGYKNCSITDAKITSGEGTTSVSNGELKVKLTKDSILAIENTPELGNLTIEKIGANSEKLAGVEFVLWKGDAYLKLNDASVTTPIETSNSGIDITKYSVTTVSSASQATKFKTNSSGKIVINNLEIYSAKGTKYNYWIQETKNDIYGYELMTMTADDVTVTGGNELEVRPASKEIKFDISSSTTVNISNHRKLGNIQIEKIGYDSEKLQNVKFVIRAGTKQYLQLKNSSNKAVTTVTGIATINLKNVANSSEYAVAYTTDKSKATRFVTNSEGKTGVNNVKIYDASGNKYNYVLQEIENSNYGYNAMTITKDDVTINGGEKVEVESSTKEIKFTITNTAKITITNHRELGNLEIHKVGENEENLGNVTFVIGAGTNEYLQLKDSNGKAITTITGTATINIKNVASTKEYSLAYVTDKAKATRFITNSSGKITINNVKVNKTTTEKYSYTAYEISNINYGYGTSSNTELTGSVTKLKINKTNKIKITNIKNLGNLELIKYDTDNKNILLEDIGFAVEISPSASKKHAYLALYNNKGELVSSVKGKVTINNNNIATKDGKQYKVSYYCTDTELSENDKKNITTFITGSDGKLTINNLELYQIGTGSEYKYKLKEITNPYYEYDVKSAEISEITLEKSKTITKELGNKQIYMKISGYVWLENPSGKSDSYDNVFTANSTTAFDKKLIDLYKTGTNGIQLNSAAEIPVEIKLYKKDGTLVKDKPDEFNTKTGEYTFVDLVIKDLENYEVVFEYDGFKYTTIKNGTEDNSSKAVETPEERKELNQKFETIKDNGEIISTDGTKNKAEYEKEGHTSTISEFNFDTNTTADTTNAKYNIKDKFNTVKSKATKPVEKINNINMGIVLREQPKLALGSDIYSVYVDVNQKGYTYYYDGRQNHYDNLNGDEVGVKFEQENSKNRYTRTIYSSDIEALKNGSATMNVSITYKIRLFNQSRTLTSVVKEIENYFDSRYTVEAIGTSFEEVNAAEKDRKSNFTIKETKTNVNIEKGEGVTGIEKAYTAVRIKLNNGIELKAKEKKDIYIKFKLSKDAIKGLLKGESTYHNASEILSYTTYYSSETQKVDGKQFITEQGKTGELYAGIDKTSQPGNAKLKLIKDKNAQGTTPILDTSEFEDDTSSAPSLLLEAVESRKISGTIFEDKATSASLKNGQKLGDGIYNNGEKPIAGVEVELRKVNDDGTIGDIARYSDATKYYEGTEVKTTTDKNGNYTFGYYDETNKKFVGILPGKYVIKYTYNNESYIVDSAGNKNLNVNDYKSTIITSNVIKSAINKQDITYNNVKYSPERWYTIQEAKRYSDAIDSLDLRKTLDEDEVKYSTYEDSTSKNYVMEAYTPVMEIGVEFTGKDAAEALTLELVKELKNIDFGIIERPDIKITVDKQITSLEITAQNGANIIPQGNPSKPEEKMQYVKTGLDGVVYAEIDPKLLQGAKLNVEYTISAKNNCQIDYLEDEYYLYGTVKKNFTLRKTRISKLADYLDNSMTIAQEEIEKGVWTQSTAKELYDKGLISEEVRKQLEEGEYHILITEEFAELKPGEEGEVKLHTTKYLAASDIIAESNNIEIIELEGGRTIEETIPGNHEPEDPTPEPDGDEVELIITPPTGTTVNYVLYIGAAAGTFVILVLGIIIIKKRIIK